MFSLTKQTADNSTCIGPKMEDLKKKKSKHMQSPVRFKCQVTALQRPCP